MVKPWTITREAVLEELKTGKMYWHKTDLEGNPVLYFRVCVVVWDLEGNPGLGLQGVCCCLGPQGGIPILYFRVCVIKKESPFPLFFVVLGWGC